MAIYSKLINSIQAPKVVLDLPMYLSPKVSTSAEVRTFYLSTISDLSNRIAFYSQFEALNNKVIPVISVLEPVSNEHETLIKQFEQISPLFPQVAFRILQ